MTTLNKILIYIPFLGIYFSGKYILEGKMGSDNHQYHYFSTAIYHAIITSFTILIL